VLVSIPGEMTEEMGRRVRASVLDAMQGSGVGAAVISGLANEYADYFTTPEEFDEQHYEGGATVYGRASSVALEEALTALAGSLAAGKPAPDAYPFDPTNGLKPDAAPFSTGAASGSVTAQPGASAARLTHPTFAWKGGERGFDRPLDSAFVLVQRQVTVKPKPRKPRKPHKRRRHRHRGRSAPAFTGKVSTRWKTVDSDLGLRIVWTVDDDGVYRAHWEVPRSAPLGSYRFVVRANRYALASEPFKVVASQALTAVPVQGGVELRYPQPSFREGVGDPPGDVDATLTHLPERATGGRATFVVDGRKLTVAPRGGVYAGSGSVAAGAVADSYGNTNGNAVTVRP
jgi:neutral ceramidase